MGLMKSLHVKSTNLFFFSLKMQIVTIWGQISLKETKKHD